MLKGEGRNGDQKGQLVEENEEAAGGELARARRSGGHFMHDEDRGRGSELTRVIMHHHVPAVRSV